MMKKKQQLKDSRMARVIRICHALPEGRHEIHAKHATLMVRDRVFAYYLNDHQGDGIIGLVCKVPPGENEALIAAHPAKYYMPANVGTEGWVGLRLDIAGVDGNELAGLMLGSYKLNAPNRLAVVAKLELAQAAARPTRTATPPQAPPPRPSAPAAKKAARPPRKSAPAPAPVGAASTRSIDFLAQVPPPRSAAPAGRARPPRKRAPRPQSE